MNQTDKKCTKMQQPRQKSTKIGASTENSTQTESVLDENPIQTKWGFEKRTEIDQPNKKRTKFTQLQKKMQSLLSCQKNVQNLLRYKKFLQKPLNQLNRGAPWNPIFTPWLDTLLNTQVVAHPLHSTIWMPRRRPT